jgi:maltose alpha-D-glucosyltransferase/alpha-amylase
MHAVLARPTSDPAFAPARGTGATAVDFADRVRQQLVSAYNAIATVDDEDRRVMDSARVALFARLHSLANGVEGAALTRIHGDLHLGQVLVVNGDVAIIDFEGEPAKPIAIRRSKDHPLRDVAGMIRSFDYAAAMVRRRSQASHAHLADEQVTAFTDSFVERATDAFVAGYHEVLGAAPGHNLDAALLDLFLIEKAAYEVVYEAANRPAWIDVPLHGLARRTRHLLGIEALV